jgi:hypothetical protein
MRPPLDVTEDPFLLELPLENTQRLFDVVSKYLYFHEIHPRFEPAAPDIFTTPRGGSCFIANALGNHIFLPASSPRITPRIGETSSPFHRRLGRPPFPARAGWKALVK